MVDNESTHWDVVGFLVNTLMRVSPPPWGGYSKLCFVVGPRCDPRNIGETVWGSAGLLWACLFPGGGPELEMLTFLMRI